jgi:quercetin dioxygenase-like cupin family protein
LPGAKELHFPGHFHDGRAPVFSYDGAREKHHVRISRGGVQMKSRRAWIAACLAVVLAIVIVVTNRGTGHAAMSSPVAVARAAFPVTVKAGQYDLIVTVGDFAPGAGVPLHFHPGPAVDTVLKGELTVIHGGHEHVYRAGEQYTESPNDQNEVVNRSSSVTRIAVAFLIPKGANWITFVK